jgi:type IV secretory pathway ATPase VirB11/archaellum biosynthesis ATPase
VAAEVIREGDDTILYIRAAETEHASIEDNPAFFERVCKMLVENKSVTKIMVSQRQDAEYDYDQTHLLHELAGYYRRLLREKEQWSYSALSAAGTPEPDNNARWNLISQAVHNGLLSDPLGTYVVLKRAQRRAQIELEKSVEPLREGIERYWTALAMLTKGFEELALYERTKSELEGLRPGDRAPYRKLFTPQTKPDFMFTKLLAAYPKDGQEVASYSIGPTEVTIFKLPDTVQYLYHIIPPEFKLSEDHYELLDSARTILAEHKPSREEFVDPKRMREVFGAVGSDLLEELAGKRGIKLSEEDVDTLTQILIRYTVGFGLVEVLLADDHVQDITVNSPAGKSPIFIVHADFEDCMTNIIPTRLESDSWASKLRLISGRPLDEANPIIDTDILVPGVASARVGAISPPLNPTGLAFAFRRHRDRPWTLALLMQRKMINALAAGLLSFFIDGNRTMLIAGTRSAGKSSLLGAVMVEIMRKYRVITIEDTLELPSDALRELGYNIQQMKVASALSKGSSEVSADEGIRTTLRLGDSALIVGEVRSTEARALYEAMRVGALANVVAGTIHGDSPYGVYDRVVNDLEVPKTSFKATDILVVANPVRSADGLHRERRVTEICEVRKHWENDPVAEGGFVTLMRYNPHTDELEPTDELINGDSEIVKAIAGGVAEWAGNWPAVWENILLRAKAKETLLRVAKRERADDLLEAGFIIQSNDQFHKAAMAVKEETGTLDSDRIFFVWNDWLERQVKRRALH